MEKAVFTREYKNGYYSLPAYFFSKTVVELPHNVLFPLLLTCITYWMVGYQNEGDKFIICAIALILLTNCGTAIGIFAACAFDSLQVALAVVPMFLLPLMIFSGFFVNSDYIPVRINRIGKGSIKLHALRGRVCMWLLTALF
jgi:ABC-type multidrug transport system permease subunit